MAQETKESVAMPTHIASHLLSLSHYEWTERCGLMRIDSQGYWHVEEVSNRSTERSEFKMAPEDLRVLWDKYGEDLIGVWHTHVHGDPIPSPEDQKWAPVGMRYWIVTYVGVFEYRMNTNPPELIHFWRKK